MTGRDETRRHPTAHRPGWMAVASLVLLQYLALGAPSHQVPYSEFIRMVSAGRFERVVITPTEVRGRLKQEGGKRVVAKRPPGMDERPLIEALTKSGTPYEGRSETSASWWMWAWMVPLLMILFLWFLGWRTAMGGSRGPMEFGRTRARIYDRSAELSVTFDDVAGVDEAEAELAEIVDFLKHPEKYQRLGGRIPKGVLLVGPPGTGKTLLARAVAGEANVPFFAISGSEFVEMFVGVGASRVRDLFLQAKMRAPCIIFIDELDAIGKVRLGGPASFTGGHDEREQTLNQLLSEMDGFDPSMGVIIIAATNKPEVLDPALRRAGRFDRQIVVDRPDVKGREAILRVHARKIKLAPDVDLGVIAARTPGMVGADLANIVNEAALLAARRNADAVGMDHFEEAIDRIMLGLEKKGRVMGQVEKERIAYHEAGHAVVALSVHHADPVHRVTIIPRSIGTLGATLQLPTEDRYLLTKQELEDRLTVLLGGRAAEEIAFGDVSTGAQDDLERATELARQMVTRFGMSDALGPRTFGRPLAGRYLQPSLDLGEERNYSERTAELIDEEVGHLIDHLYGRAKRILTERRAALVRIARELETRETLNREDLERLVARDEKLEVVIG